MPFFKKKKPVESSAPPNFMAGRMINPKTVEQPQPTVVPPTPVIAPQPAPVAPVIAPEPTQQHQMYQEVKPQQQPFNRQTISEAQAAYPAPLPPENLNTFKQFEQNQAEEEVFVDDLGITENLMTVSIQFSGKKEWVMEQMKKLE